MGSLKSRNARVASITGILILCVAVLFFLLRGPYLSNYIKRILIPVLENATRERIIIDKAVINLFPFYIQAKGFKMFDKDGNRLLWITKSRIYIDLSGLLSREITVRKLTLMEPDLTINEDDLQRLMENLGQFKSVGDKEQYSLSIRNIKMTDGNLAYSTTKGIAGISGSGLYMDLVPKDTSYVINVLMKNAALKLQDNSELAGGFVGKVTVEDNRVKITELKVTAADSSFATEGEIMLSDEGTIVDGSLSVKAKIYMSIINKIFELKKQKDGILSFDGQVKLIHQDASKWPALDLDLKTDSQFYLESLMEILEVDENVTGQVSVKGEINGLFPEVTGKGTGTLKDGVLDTFPVDELTGKLTYEDRKFALNSASAHALGGTLEGYAQILIPSGDYIVDARAADISSPQFFQFIEWEPPFQEGKISGDVYLNHDNVFKLIASLDYRSISSKVGNVVDRMHSAHSALELTDDLLRLKNTVLSTDRSDLYLDGVIDLEKKTLDLNLNLKSADAADLTEPYYAKFSAPVNFKGTLSGPAEGPEIKGRVKAESGSIHGIKFTEGFADLSYRAVALVVDRLVISQDKATCDLSGNIHFRKAEGLFSFNDPFYKAKAELKNVDINPFIKVFYGEVPVSGRISGLLSFEGSPDDFISPGTMVVNNVDIYGRRLDKINTKFEVRPKEIKFTSFNAHKAESDIEAKGTLFFNKEFTLSAMSDRMRLQDVLALNNYSLDMLFGVDLKGSGSIDNPELKFSIDIAKSYFKGVNMGKGEIKGNVKNKKLYAAGNLIDGLVTVKATALFSDTVGWNVDSVFNKGRYDFLAAGFIKEVPEDFQLSLEGGVRLTGQGDNFSVNSKFNYADLNLYGFNVINREAVEMAFKDDELQINSLSLTGKDADFNIDGRIKPYVNYDLHMKGDMDLAPLRALNAKISMLRGRSSFKIDIAGPWKKPELNGEVNLSNAAATLSEIPYTIGPANGTIFLKKNRVTFDSINSRFAGGSVVLSGAGHLDGLSSKKYFMSADFGGIKLKPVEGLNMTLDGRLFYDVSSKGSSVTGNIDIKKARYTKRIEWKSWFFELKKANEKRINYPAFLADTLLNVSVTGSDNISIDNNIARTPVKIALNLTGTVAHSGLLGRIEANEGTLYFRSNEFNILEGSSVDFIEPDRITPFYHILAETYINNYHIKLTLDGIMEEFTLSMFSSPPLSETDIIALLTVGQTGKEAKGIESGIAAGEATAILTGALQDTVEEQFQYVTGFERFEIEPHTTVEGAFIPKVTVGKRLFGDKLFVTYSTVIGTAEEDVIKLEYKIDKNISLIGSRNEIGSAGVDLKYKFEFK